jgi:hypothetical protein
MRWSRLSLFKKILVVAYLATALVFIQSARLHIHTYDHDPATLDHLHHEQAHFDFSDAANEAGIADDGAQIDLSQQGLLKKLIVASLLVALFAVAIFLPLAPQSQFARRLLGRIQPLPWPFSLRPPLRAPPL